jgi:hypothetical protein
MNRVPLYNYIDEKLHTLAHRIETNGKLNMLHLHMHSENFYLHFFNLLYGFDLRNLNDSQQNVEAIDLIDDTNKLLIQVSATCSKSKIEGALSKGIIQQYATGYTFKFISISKDANYQRKNSFKNPYNISFDPSKDIYDVTSILNVINGASITKQKAIYQFIKDELGGDVDVVKLDSNLATIINLLSKEQWDDSETITNVTPFEIDKKISYNQLEKAKYIIEDYFLFHHKVDAKYAEFDKMGVNKSISVLAKIRNEYIKLTDNTNPDKTFFDVFDKICDIVQKSKNFKKIPYDELELCVHILVVDAFVRCKIFKKPDNHVT